MRLKEFTVRNFKGINEISISMPETDLDRHGSGEFVSIVGENNAGKSSILRALQLALPMTEFSRPKLDHFPDRKTSTGPIEVELLFENIPEEIREKQGVRTHMQGGEYRIKKVWNAPGNDPTYYAYLRQFEHPDWVDSKRKRHTYIEAGGQDAESVIEKYEEDNGELEDLDASIREQLFDIGVSMGVSYIEEVDPDWSPNPGGIRSNVDSAIPNAILIPAIKKPSEEVDTGKKSTSVGRLMNTLFDDHLIHHEVVKGFLEQSKRVQSIFQGEEQDELVSELEQSITEKIQRMIDIETTILFEPPDVTSGLVRNTELEVIDGDVRTKPEHQGHGAQRALILSLLELIAEDRAKAESEKDVHRPLVLLIEEPEIYMHPQMLRRLRDVLLEIARSETAQVVCTTHSPVFIDLADRHDGLAILRKESDDVTAFQRKEDIFPGDSVEEQRDRLRMILDFDPTVNESFFASHVCLVEGDTELAVTEAIARKLDMEDRIDYQNYLDRRRHVTLVPCRGKWNIRSFQRVLNGFGIEYSVVHDEDPGKSSEAANAQIRELHSNPDGIMIMEPDLERAFFNDTWNSDKPWRATQEILGAEELPEEVENYFEFVIGEGIDTFQN